MPESFAVLLAEPEQLRSPLLGEALAKHEGVPLADASSRALASWGLLLENVPRARAEALAGALCAAGLRALVVSQDRLAALPEAREAAAAAFPEAATRWTLKPEGEALELADGEVAVIAAAAWRREEVRTVKVIEGPNAAQKLASLGILMTTGLPIKIGKEREVEKTEKSVDLSLRLELLGGAPARRVRVDPGDFNFACLGSRMQYASFLNFRALLGLLRERLPKARLTWGAKGLLEGRMLSQLGYSSPADLEREERWLLSLGAP